MSSQPISFIWQFNLELSLLILLVLLLRWALKKSAKVYNCYWLWLALPLAPIAAEVTTMVTPKTQQIIIFEQYNRFSFSSEQARKHSDSDSRAPLSSTSPLALSKDSLLVKPVILIWLLGAGLLMLRLAKQHQNLRKQLISADYTKAINLNSRFPVMGVTAKGFSPAVYGFWNPKIYFPIALFDKLDPEQSAQILQHEEQHIKQGHLWLNLVWDVLICINWFNPVLYFARRCFRHDQELLCDHLVLKNHDEPNQAAYGHALISTASATHSVSLLCSWKMFNQLEERIMNIKTQHKTMKHLILAGTVASVLSLSSLYAIANSDTNNSETSKESTNTKAIEISEKDDALTEESVHSIRIVNVNNDGDKTISINVNGKTYHSENDTHFILEDGKRRDLSKQESEEFSDLLERNKRYAIIASPNRGGVFDQQKVYSYSFDGDNIDIDKIEAQIEKAQGSAPGEHFDIRSILQTIETTDSKIEQALKDVENTKRSDITRIKKELSKAQKQLEKARAELKTQEEYALKQLEKLKEASQDQG